jgi:hypothetical protein
MTPLINKLYSFDHGAKSENKEVIEAIEQVNSIIEKNVTPHIWQGHGQPNLSGFYYRTG